MRLSRVSSLVSLLCLSLLSSAAVRAESPVVLSGFVDSSLSYRFTDTDQGLLLGLDQAELDVAVTLSQLKLRIDLQYFPAQLTDPADGPAPIFDRIVEQGFAELFFAEPERGLFLRAGKWNAPVGFETVDPTGLWQYSQGLLFTYATPANLTGVAFGWVGASTQAQLWVSNAWDQPGTPKETHLGARLQQALGDAGTIGLSSTFGALADADPKLMLDLDAALTFGILRLGLQVNFGMLGDDTSLGFLVAANVAVAEGIGVTARFDWLDREIPDAPYKGASATLAGLFNLAQGFDLIAEVRADLPDGGDAEVVGALEALASF